MGNLLREAADLQRVSKEAGRGEPTPPAPRTEPGP
jgi:hypothetical protein